MRNIILMIIAYVAMIAVNVLSNTLPINGQTAAEISDNQNVLFTPASYVFSIWTLIYLLIGIWLFLQFKNRATKNGPPANNIAYLFIVSCGLNMVWLLTWHYEYFAISIIIMFILLITLIFLYKNYSKNNYAFSGRLPFSFYLGWISVATIANMCYTLQYYDISLGIDEVPGTIGLLITAGVLAILGRYLSNDPYFALVFVWAIIGIARANSDSSLVTTAYVVTAIIFVAIIAMFFIKKPRTTY